MVNKQIMFTALAATKRNQVIMKHPDEWDLAFHRTDTILKYQHESGTKIGVVRYRIIKNFVIGNYFFKFKYSFKYNDIIIKVYDIEWSSKLLSDGE